MSDERIRLKLKAAGYSRSVTRLFELSQSSRQVSPQGSTRPVALASRRPVPGILMPELQQKSTQLILRGRNPLVKSRSPRRVPPLLKFLFDEAVTRNKRMCKLQPGPEVPIGLVTGTGSRALGKFDLQRAGTAKIRVPAFLDRHVTAAGLKQLAGHPNDVVLRKRGSE
jgi:hypothetical protein